MIPGRFITVEGLEGVGKSTNLTVIAEAIRARGHPLVVTREPGGTPAAESIRRLLLDVDGEPIEAMTELLLVFAARAQHVTRVIRPALARGDWVLCDRFTDATYAYQGGGRGLEEGAIAALEALVHGDLMPDLTVYLDGPVDLGLERIQGRTLDRFERERHAFFERAREVYRCRAERLDRFVLVDAAAPLDAVRRAIETHVNAFLDRHD